MSAIPNEQIRTGLYPGLTRVEYERIPAINVSTLEHFERSAAHAREAMIHPKAPSAAMDLGTALHVAVLEPARFAKEYVAAPKCDRRTKDGKQAWAEFESEHPAANVMDASDFIDVLKMRESLYRHPIAAAMLRSFGHNEVGVVWQNEETGLQCKGLIDRISPFDGWTWVIDLKKVRDASRHGFSKATKTYHYGAKAAYYLDGCNFVSPRERRFAWIAIEDYPPYAVAVYEPDDTAIAVGRSKYMRWLRLYQEAIETNTWPGYDAQIEALGSENTEWRS